MGTLPLDHFSRFDVIWKSYIFSPFFLFCDAALIHEISRRSKKLYVPYSVKYHNGCPWHFGLKKIKREKKNQNVKWRTFKVLLFYITTHNFIVCNAFNLTSRFARTKRDKPLKLRKTIYSLMQKRSFVFSSNDATIALFYY